jgi:hypothetical protein
VSSIEDRLRDAYRDAADTVRPDGIRKMHEPSVIISMPGDREVRRGPRRFVIPLAAAAAVAVVGVLAGVVVPGALSASRSARGSHRPPAATGIGRSDRYIVAANGAGTALVIHNARTGARVGTVAAPVGGMTFSGLATGDGARYVAELWVPGVCRTWLYQFQLDRAGQPGELTAYALPSIRQLLQPIAVSADGSTFAYEGENCSNPAGTSASELAVLNLTTMKTARWAIPKQADVSSLSLTADGSMLAYNIGKTKLFASAAYVLPTSAAPGSALQRSRVVARGSHFSRGGAIGSDVISPDGSTLYFTTNATGAAYDKRWQLRAADLPGGTTHIVAQYRGFPELMAADWSVTRAIVQVQLPSPSGATPSPSDHGTLSPAPGKHDVKPTPAYYTRRRSGPTPGTQLVMINLHTGKILILNPRIWNPNWPAFSW